MIVAHFQTATEYVALHALTLEPFVRLTIFFPHLICGVSAFRVIDRWGK